MKTITKPLIKSESAINKRLLSGAKRTTFLLLGLLAVTASFAQEKPKTPTENTLTSIISLTGELFQKCPKMEEGLEQCMNQVLRQRECKTNNPWVQDESGLDDIKKYGFVTMSGEGQCIPNAIFSRIVEDLAGDSYFLEFTLNQKPTSEEIKNLKARKRFNSLNEYEGNGLIFDISQNEPNFSIPGTTRILVGTSQAWKSREFTFAKYFTLDKTDRLDIQRSTKQHSDIYSLLGGKGRITGLGYGPDGKLVQIKIDASEQLVKALNKSFTKRFGEPEIVELTRTELNPKKNAEMSDYFKALAFLKDSKLSTDFYSKCKSKKFGFVQYNSYWTNDLIRIQEQVSNDFYCVGEPNLRFGGITLNKDRSKTFTIISQSYLFYKEKEEEIKKLKLEEQEQKEQEEVSKLF